MTDEMQVGVENAPALESSAGAIAPWWHTLAVLVVLATWAVLSHGRSSEERSGHHLMLYVSSMMMSWMLMGAVVAGVYVRRQFFFEALQRRGRPFGVDLLRGAGIYLGIAMLFGCVAGIAHFLHKTSGFDQTAVKALAPQSALEMLVWVGLSLSAGICEELVFRGYLLRQAIGLLRTAGVSSRLAQVMAVASTAVLFGSLHLYEGYGGAALIMLLGAAYAVIALRLGNLRAVMIAHVMQDLLAGVLMFAITHVKR